LSTLRVDIQYRPLRVGWVIPSSDISALRTAVRLSYALWGGTFNPILFSDRPSEAKAIAKVFRVDALITIPEDNSTSVLDMPYLRGPLWPHQRLFTPTSEHHNPAAVLDVEHAVEHSLQVAATGTLQPPVIVRWDPNDPLADAFLLDFGRYPAREDCRINYDQLLVEKFGATEVAVGPDERIPARASAPSLSAVSRIGLQYSWPVGVGWPPPGIFVGRVDSVEDLACYWNVRALGADVLFVDPRHAVRYSDVIPARLHRAKKNIAQWHESNRHTARWLRADDATFTESYPELDKLDHSDEPERWLQPVTAFSWNGLNFKAPTAYIDSTSTLGMLHQTTEPRVSFALPDKPLSSEHWFSDQWLAASVRIFDPLQRDSQHTFGPIYLPELNETYGQVMTSRRDQIRVEPSRIAILIRPRDSDCTLVGFSTMAMMQEAFRLAGYHSQLSTAGKIARQLVSTLGGLQGARPFKIPGVRRLISSLGPNDCLSARDAVNLIAARDRKTKPFGPHADLRIEPRDPEYKLSPPDVFAYLVEKGLFLCGVKFQCPHCLLPSWIPIESTRHEMTCSLCGQTYAARRQLAGAELFYRKSSLLGIERHMQGSMPVVLTLQQLDANLRDVSTDTLSVYSLSTELTSRSGQPSLAPDVELDFTWLVQRCHKPRMALILGECKGNATLRIQDFTLEMDKLRRLADSISGEQFETFILFSKLGTFTAEELAYAKQCNEQHRLRVILLSDDELEPFDVFDGIHTRELPGTPEALAEATARKYFVNN
jgi:hypothetical protein